MKKKILDITQESCPMTFLRTKNFLKENVNLSEKYILVKGEKNFISLKEALEKKFSLNSKKINEDIYEIKLS